MIKAMLKNIIATIIMCSFAFTAHITSANNIEPINFNHSNTGITFKKSKDFTQGIIDIKDCHASKTFNFKVSLNPGEKLITARELLGEDCDTGEVFIVDSHNFIKKIIEKPWAKDSNNISIPTYFNISGNILSQFISHSCDNSFPIEADPNLWEITMCAGAIALVIGGIALPAVKILKIKKAIKIAGGLSVFAKLCIGILMGAKDAIAAVELLGPIVLEAIQTLLGIDGIMKNCRF